MHIIANDTDPADYAQLARLDDELRCICTSHVNVDQALNHVILEAYDNMFTAWLEYYMLQYANMSALEILVHLLNTYTFINPTQLADSYNKMKEPISFQFPIDNLFKYIEDGIWYAIMKCILTWRHNACTLHSFWCSTQVCYHMLVKIGNNEM
jgi:hypothetical protein